MNRLIRNLSFLFCPLFIGSIGCQKKVSDVEHFEASTRLVGIYLTTNAVSAESAMLELLEYTRKAQESGTRGVPFDMHLAAIHRRLYLVQTKLMKTEEAAENFQKASNYWQAVNTRLRLPPLNATEVYNKIHVVDPYFGEPSWQTER